jgi:hypothetical protein
MVVVAMMVALVGVMSLSLNTVFSSRARRCAYAMNSYIEMCRVRTLSRAGSVYIEFDTDGEGRVRGSYYEGSDPTAPPKSSELLSGGGVEVVFKVGGSETTLSAANKLKLSFDRETGAFKPVSGTDYCTEIRVTSGRTYVITLVPSTGSHTIG